MKLKLLTLSFLIAVCPMLWAAEPDYSDGVFILNEDWFGHQNSTINFLRSNGEWDYRIFQKENPGMELGCTAQYGVIFNGRMYIISKQEKDKGATVTGGRITVCDAKTLKCIKQIQMIAVDEKGNSVADGRGFVGITDKKGYISTSNGIYPFDLETFEIKPMIDGTGNFSGSLYSDQCGMMLYDGKKYVYAINQSKGLFVIDAVNDVIVKTIAPPVDMENGKEMQRGFGSIVQSKDGDYWMSVALDVSDRGEIVDYFMHLDPATHDTTRIALPQGFGTPNSWYAWTADAFCASSVENKLYWKKQGPGWFSNSVILCYDIATGKCNQLFDTYQDYNGWYMYCGAAFRLHPQTDDLYITCYRDNLLQNYIILQIDNTGSFIAQYEMIDNYWFPAMPIFPVDSVAGGTTPSGVDNVEYPSIVVYPNPTSDYISFSLEREGSISILDCTGREVYSMMAVSGENQISVSHLHAGVYILKSESSYTRFIKQ